jgi:hypothetical protein
MPVELRGIHDVFHASQLRKYFTDLDHVVNDANIELTPNSNLVEEPIRIIYEAKE